MNIDRSKVIAIITGIFSLLLGVLYLGLVQILDFRGEMIPAPVEMLLGAFLHRALLPAAIAFGYS
jgi:hypothetical protein